jgi:hypothetical protein
VHGFRESHQDRSDGLRAAKARRKLVSDVAGLQVREDQNVGPAFGGC